MYLYLFDCLYYEGVNHRNLPLLDRKAVLRDVVWFDDPSIYSISNHRVRRDVSRGLRSRG